MNATAILRSIRTSTSRFEERADGIIVQRVLTTRTRTAAEARENIAAFAVLTNGEPRPALIDMRISRALQPSVRDLYTDPENAQLFSVVALLVASPASWQIGQHFASQPAFAARLRQFADETEAVAWLHRFAAEPVAAAGA